MILSIVTILLTEDKIIELRQVVGIFLNKKTFFLLDSMHRKFYTCINSQKSRDSSKHPIVIDHEN